MQIINIKKYIILNRSDCKIENEKQLEIKDWNIRIHYVNIYKEKPREPRNKCIE